MIKEWFASAELVGMPGVANCYSGIYRMAVRQSWKFKERFGKGGGKEYHFSSLPPVTQLYFTLKETNSAENEVKVRRSVEERLQRTENLAKFGTLPEYKQIRAKAKSFILEMCRTFLSNSNYTKTKGIEVFTKQLKEGEIKLPEWTIEPLKKQKYHPNTIFHWFKQEYDKGILGLVDNYGNRRGKGTIESNEELKKTILGLIAEKPHIRPSRIFEYLEALNFEHGKVTLRAVQRYIKKWKDNNPQQFLLMSDPDAWKSKYKVSVGKADENVKRLNQIWEMDSTPADVMLTDGRYCIIGVIDVYSRRTMLLVSKTSKAVAIATLFRQAVMAWGMPEAVRLDNGKDYQSKHFQRILTDLEVETKVCKPFASEQKPFIERFFRTFSHDVLELLDGYIGHNVAERKQIEARKTFAQRIFNKDDLIDVNLCSEELQKYCDAFTLGKYYIRAHGGLKGKAPKLMVESWTGRVVRIQNERALDILLMETEIKKVHKKGIKHDNCWYSDVEGKLIPLFGQNVIVKQDPANVGKLLVFAQEEDGTTNFICEAINPDFNGVSRTEVSAKLGAIQKKFIKRQNAERKEFKKTVKKNIAEIISESNIEAASKIVALPNRNEDTFGNELLDACAQAASPSVDKGCRRPLTAEEHQTFIEENFTLKVEEKKRLSEIVDNQELFDEWKKFHENDFAGMSEEEKCWRNQYERTSRFRGQLDVYYDLGKGRDVPEEERYQPPTD